jgi:hypothetical protein
MQTKEIPREQWMSFLDGFSRRHDHWSVSVDVITPELGPQTEINHVPLVGISADQKDGENSIAIMAGRDVATRTTHLVEGANRIWLEQSDDGEEQSIQIESETGMKTLVRFRDIVESS